jgi:hypothetical protein
MPNFTAQRTLVKSAPELWSELSELERLARHLGAFGEIRITRREPEQMVAWQGQHGSGTVRIEPSAWGTKVTLTAMVSDLDEPAEAPRDVRPAPPDPGVEPRDAPEAPPPPVPRASSESAAEELGALAAPPLEPQRAGPGHPDPRRSFGERLLDRVFPGWRAPAAFEPATPPGEPGPAGHVPELAEGEREDPLASALGELEHSPRREPATEAARALAAAKGRLGTRPAPALGEAPVREVVDEAPVRETLDAAPALKAVPEPPMLELVDEAPSRQLLDAARAREVLDGVLDSLGSAHHRPFSRG